jgi:hypothetical protein
VPAAHVVIDTVGGAVLDGSYGLLRGGGRARRPGKTILVVRRL